MAAATVSVERAAAGARNSAALDFLKEPKRLLIGGKCGGRLKQVRDWHELHAYVPFFRALGLNGYFEVPAFESVRTMKGDDPYAA